MIIFHNKRSRHGLKLVGAEVDPVFNERKAGKLESRNSGGQISNF